jgi:broad specificity phosphatase PhoE
VRRVENSIREFSKLYVTLQQDGSEEDMSYVIFINYGQKVVTNRMHGFLRMRIAQFLSTYAPRPRPARRVAARVVSRAPSRPRAHAARVRAGPPTRHRSIHTELHTIYLTRHGQSEYNRLGKIGGNSGVTQYGLEYAQNLAAFARDTICKEDGVSDNKARLWTSSMRRTNETAQFIAHPEIETEDGGKWSQMSHRIYRNLDEIFAGEYEGLTYEEVAERFEDEAFLRKVDKIGYRYPRERPRADATRPASAVEQLASRTSALAHIPMLTAAARPSLPFPPHWLLRCQVASRTSTSSRGSTRWCTNSRATTSPR